MWTQQSTGRMTSGAEALGKDYLLTRRPRAHRTPLRLPQYSTEWTGLTSSFLDVSSPPVHTDLRQPCWGQPCLPVQSLDSTWDPLSPTPDHLNLLPRPWDLGAGIFF